MTADHDAKILPLKSCSGVLMNTSGNKTEGGADVQTYISKLIHVYVHGRIQRQEVKSTTGSRQEGILRSFAASFGQRPVKNMSKTDIERWLASRGRRAAGTRRNEISTLRSFTKWLQIEGVLRRDPMLQIRNVRLPRRVPRALTALQVEAIWGVLPDNRARAIFALMRWCGLRRCEILALEVGDWDREAELIHVVGKGDNERDVPVITRAAAALDAYFADASISAGPMIRTLNGRRAIGDSYLGQLVSGWMYEAGVKERGRDGKACHSFRHTLAKRVADEEPDLRVTQEMLGHSLLATTQIYAGKAKFEKMRTAMEAAA